MVAALRNRAGYSLRGFRLAALADVCALMLGCGSGNLGSLVGGSVAADQPRESRSGSASTESLSADAGAVTTAANSGYCGDGVIQSALGEQCDGAEQGGLDCTSLGYPGGELHCQLATCQFDTAECQLPDAGPPAAIPKQDAAMDGGTAGAGGKSGTVGMGAATTAMGTCPIGFTCGAFGQGAQHQCMAWGEDAPPVCFTPGPGDCATALPGATCTDMGIAMFCVLACSP